MSESEHTSIYAGNSIPVITPSYMQKPFWKSRTCQNRWLAAVGHQKCHTRPPPPRLQHHMLCGQSTLVLRRTLASASEKHRRKLSSTGHALCASRNLRRGTLSSSGTVHVQGSVCPLGTYGTSTSPIRSARSDAGRVRSAARHAIGCNRPVAQTRCETVCPLRPTCRAPEF